MTAVKTPPRRIFSAARTYISELWNRREFAWYLALGNLKARNASTTLGLLWWVINPLLLAGVYWLVFGLLFDRGTLDLSRGTETGLPFLAFLLSGMFPFFFTQSAMTGGVNSIVSNTKLLANLHFPRLILPIAALLESTVGFVASLGVFFMIVGPINGIWPGPWTLWLPVAMVIQLVFNFGLSTIVARVAVPFRDLNNLVPYFTRLWLYLSPVIYEAAFVEGKGETIEFLFRLNPLFSILELYRHALTGVDINLAGSLTISTLWAVGFAVAGVTLFVKYEGKMARYL
ncbi:MAG: ABC transporter permease [Acidimicrobiia bacterium]|nr:ABC transporter permease [Acidimicrobiia bacterium]